MLYLLLISPTENDKPAPARSSVCNASREPITAERKYFSVDVVYQVFALFQVLFLSHPRHMIRDTSRYLPFRELVGGKTPSLRNLTKLILGLTIQEGEHDSVTDARATMCLYLSRKVEWEAKLKQRIKMNSRSKQK